MSSKCDWDYTSGEANHMETIAAVTTIELWLQEHVDSRTTVSPPPA
ncbi:MAG: hypothetical protein ABEH35_02180 [Haloarculaceae archaeon]